MPTLNVKLDKYEKKKHTKLIKITNICLLFRSFVNVVLLLPFFFFTCLYIILPAQLCFTTD